MSFRTEKNLFVASFRLSILYIQQDLQYEMFPVVIIHAVYVPKLIKLHSIAKGENEPDLFTLCYLRKIQYLVLFPTFGERKNVRCTF